MITFEPELYSIAKFVLRHFLKSAKKSSKMFQLILASFAITSIICN